ncbi:phospholipid carrier-dependent glycosyltransferase [Oculatella sp. LEGE 06141]|uniref:dolichyl-phosphate-mannose--protein mannosyltransferase n=1 Tax=Oculatella sp. LEGE 06141 TaxID=1828648 RepID=UPI00187F97B0|nr:phospholipid carrier-dependent glycosyltransferase [Oculatella sp. LEGE 06141]MBE9181115.1 phospholipid carrier-dependent glycosyltransferase [Oculatella sp. LEGE 06141]
MTAYSKYPQWSLPWFGIGMVGVFLLSVALRFWGLSRFNTLVFDEVYYAKFASHFLKGELLFGGHPPLSTYIIAIGIWLGDRIPLGDHSLRNGLSGLFISTWSYRWLNALTGAFIPLVVGAIAYQISNRRTFAFLAALFTATDGLLLVESRYALNNVYLILFGLLGQWLLLLALRVRSRQRWWRLALSGVCFGAAVAIKWNGLWFLLGAYFVWIAAWFIRIAWKIRLRGGLKPGSSPNGVSSRNGGSHREGAESIAELRHTPLKHLTQLDVGHMALNFALIPFLTYRLSWIPYMRLDPTTSFWQWQGRILDYHERVGGMDAHPYCSTWHTWMWMVRPVAYFYKTSHGSAEPVSVVGPPLPQSTESIVYDVHAMGNPLLWWFATAAIFLLISLLVQWGGEWLVQPPSSRPAATLSTFPSLGTYSWVALYLVLNWLANVLPWVEVTRCTFIYHYMGASIFSFMAIALLVDRWLTVPDRWHRMAGLTIIFAVLLALVFWMPLYLGLPISPEGLSARLWFRSWV